MTYTSGPLLPPFPREVRNRAGQLDITVPIGKDASVPPPSTGSTSPATT